LSSDRSIYHGSLQLSARFEGIWRENRLDGCSDFCSESPDYLLNLKPCVSERNFFIDTV
jgi:hypothetical protein